MKVTELRAALKKRGLETDGVKAELTTRLSEALKNALDSDCESADTERDKEEEEQEEEEEEKPQKRQKSESESSTSPDEVDSLLNLPFSDLEHADLFLLAPCSVPVSTPC